MYHRRCGAPARGARPAPAGDFFDVPSKRAAQDTCFGVVDSSTYEQIHSHDTEKAVIQVGQVSRVKSS